MKYNFIPLTALLITLVAGQSKLPDPCTKLSNKSVVGYNEVLACYNNFKLSDKFRESTSDTLNKVLPFYVFNDIAKRSPDPKVPSYRDIKKELNQVLKAKYTTEFEFQVAITKYFNSLEDGHTRYTARCFEAYTFHQPFPLYVEEGKWGEIKVKVPSNLKYDQTLIDTWKAAGVDVLRYAGVEVLSINNKQPLEYIQEYAKQYISNSRDINSQINYALARTIQDYGEWGINYGAFGSIKMPPLKETLTFRFRVGNGEKSVTVPYIATPNTSTEFTDSNTFYKNNCAPYVPEEITKKSKNQPQILESPEVLKMPIDAPLKVQNSRMVDPLLSPTIDGTYIKTYVMENKVGVVHISIFSTYNEAKWFKELVDGFKALKEQGVEKLILDVSNNTGGYLCWAYNIIDYLFPDAKIKYFNNDMAYSPLLAKLTQDPKFGFFTPQDFNQPDGKPFKSNDAFTEIKTYRRGLELNSKYTPQFQEKCESNLLRELLVNGKQPFKTENIVLISNSICYSTCTTFATGLIEFHNVKSYAFGGLKNKEATIGTQAGGTVHSLSRLITNLQKADLSKDPAAPQLLLFSGDLSFTIREAYSSKYKELRPSEFTWTPAKYHKAYNSETAFNPYKVWEQVAKDF